MTAHNLDHFLPWRRLKAQGILGMNKRNGDFIAAYNQRSRYPLVDDKVKTKRLAEVAGVSAPKLYAVVEIEKQIRTISAQLAQHQDFVVKPSHGSGGEGILVITSRTPHGYRKSNGQLISKQELEYHISNILSGMYSLGGLPDTALIEQRVEFDPIFSDVSYQGVPDIRTIVFRGVPVMAMIRLPTRMSDGKANLHQGAIGVGIDLKTGITSSGVWHEQIIDRHPDTGVSIVGLEIPEWDKILHLTAQCYDLAGLGYLGVDIVLDRTDGPLMLEMNARPGLSIQIANQCGLLKRLEKIEKLKSIPDLISDRVSLSYSMIDSLT
ncbi:MAG: alpha-L-glutamate ligase-like protein [Gammaproteobacteria bacterium]